MSYFCSGVAKSAKKPGESARKPNYRSEKPTKIERKLRVDTVYGFLCEGKSRSIIVRLCAELWDCSERAVDNYLGDARQLLEADCAMTREAFMAEAMAGYREIRETAQRRGQLMCAKQCLDAQIALVGLAK